LWVSKIFVHVLPKVFQFVVGIVSSKIRRYALMIKALELPLSFIFWALCSFLTFQPLMLHNPTTSALAEHDAKFGQLQDWQRVLRQILAAILVCTIILFVEKFIIQVISVNYHNKQFGDKIKGNKRNVLLLSKLYEVSRKAFPDYCQTFYHEDNIINDSLNLSKFSKRGSGKGSGSATPMRLLHNIGRAGDTVTSAFGRVAQDMAGGAKLFDSNTSYAIVSEALEKQRASEALAKRIWMSFVCEGSDSLHMEDLVDVLGEDSHPEAEECFAFLDKDGNGDVSLDEMILMVMELGRSIKSIASSKHDVDQALKVLDRMLLAVVFIVSILVFIAFLNQSFVTSLATAGTAILSLSFVFAATCQEVLGSCIFLFVKHPYDVGDRVDLQTADQLTVEHISLLFTVFKRINNGKLVQVPNIVLNNLWVENVTRSKAMREQILLYCNFDTTFEDIEALRQEMASFVTDPANSRDFLPDVEIQVTGLAEMNKMEIRIDCRHKSNWANETIRAARRSKFMCALVLAIRKVPIYGPGGGAAALGSMDAPSYSVSVSPDDAAKYRSNFTDSKEAKRLVPSKKSDTDVQSMAGTDYSGVTAHHEMRAMQALNTRNPVVDHARDDTFANREMNSSDSTLADERRSLEEVRGLLARESTRGRRHPSHLSPVIEPPSQQTYPMPAATTQYAPPPFGTPQIPPAPNNAFNSSVQRRDVSSQNQLSRT
jgi:small-conductance mechanosensitive channel